MNKAFPTFLWNVYSSTFNKNLDHNNRRTFGTVSRWSRWLKLQLSHVCMESTEKVIVSCEEIWRTRSMREKLNVLLRSLLPGDFSKNRPTLFWSRTAPFCCSPLTATSSATSQDENSRTLLWLQDAAGIKPLLHHRLVEILFLGLRSGLGSGRLTQPDPFSLSAVMEAHFSSTVQVTKYPLLFHTAS